MDELFLHMLRDIYYAENRIVKALPDMIEKASDPQLKQGFQSHLAETKNHLKRLEAKHCRTGLARTSSRSTSSAVCQRLRCRTISKPASRSRRATSRASTGRIRISPITMASSCCRHAFDARVTRPRSRPQSASSLAS